MKKQKVLITTIFISLLLIITGIILSVTDNQKEEIVYSKINIHGYQFELNDNYEYKYLEKEDHGILENDRFLSSFVYIADEDFSTLISRTSHYTNMNSDEVDSIIEEEKFGEFDGFTNIKKVYYDDVQKEYYLVLILIRVTPKKTFVFQYEIDDQEDTSTIIEDIENGLKKIEKKV